MRSHANRPGRLSRPSARRRGGAALPARQQRAPRVTLARRQHQDSVERVTGLGFADVYAATLELVDKRAQGLLTTPRAHRRIQSRPPPRIRTGLATAASVGRALPADQDTDGGRCPPYPES